MEGEKDAARRWFDRRARSYEGGATSRWRDPVLRASLEALQLERHDRLLDVGCGTGAASRTAATTATSVVGIDLSPEMVRRANERSVGLDNVRFEVADVEDLRFDDGAFSSVLCSNSFHHYPDPARAVGEMVRVLEPGGRIVIGDACADPRIVRIADAFLRRLEPGHVRIYRSSEVGSFLHGAGLTRIMVRTLTDGAFMVVRAVRGRAGRSSPVDRYGVRMTTVLLFHHAQGQPAGLLKERTVALLDRVG
jgi:ubiquinone/menaquinone biosynthesis C-methylase UbiE